MNIYKGKLTYSLAGIAVVVGIGGWIGGWIEAERALEIVWMGLAAFGIRRALP